MAAPFMKARRSMASMASSVMARQRTRRCDGVAGVNAKEDGESKRAAAWRDSRARSARLLG